MKTFSSLKRDFRTLYKPKSKSKRPDDGQGLEENIPDTPYDDTSIQLASVSPTKAHSDDTQKLSSTQPREDSIEPVSTDTQAPVENYSQDAFRDSDVLEAASDPAPVVDEAQEYDDDSIGENEVEVQDQDQDQDDAEFLTFEEAQSLRNRVYTKFGAEEPEDFTDGPVQFVESADGLKSCVALLITYDLSQKIQAALRGQHEYSRVELEGMMRKQSLSRLQSAVHREILNCKARLYKLEDDARMGTEDGRKLEQQLTNLQLMLQDVQGRKEEVSIDIRLQAERLRKRQAAVNAHLEEAFICARLIVPHEDEPEPKIEKLDVSQEYLEFCQRLERADENIFEDAVAPLDNTRDHREVPPPSPEEQARQNVIDSLWAAKETLDLAHQNFDNRENDRAREYEANVQAADRGEDTTDESPEAFDVRWVVRFRDLTRALIEAEAVYSDVKRMVFEAGVPLPFADNESICEGVGDDTGYTISKEQELVASAPSPTVRKWLSNMPEGGETGSVGEETQLEADEWDAEEVGISDSVSLVAEGRQRSRIDRWQDACLAEKSQ
jgi:hypothetical protein